MTKILISKAGFALLIGGFLALAIRSVTREIDAYDPWAVD